MRTWGLRSRKALGTGWPPGGVAATSAPTSVRKGNDQMQYTRRISTTDAVDTGYPGYQAVFVASPESVTVLAGFLGGGGHPPLHIHDVDLFYVVLEGSATVRLGHGHHQAKAGE